MVGLAMGIRHAPAFFLGVTAGTMADLIDRRKLMRSLLVLSALVALTLGSLLASEKAQLWHLLVIPAFAGAISMMFSTTQQSFVFDLVGRQYGLNGMSYISLAMRGGAMVGALAVGFTLAKSGPGTAYFVIVVACCVSLTLLGLIRSRGRAAPVGTTNMVTGFSEFWKELRHNRTVLALVLIVVLVELFGFTSIVLMPSIARDVWDLGPGGLGILSAFSSGGGLAAIALLSILGNIRNQGLSFIVVILLFGVALIVLGFAPSIYIAVTAIVILSGMMALSDLFSQTLVQKLVPNDLRGRAMGAWTSAVGTAPIGNLEIGALASMFGITIALALHGTALIILAVAIFITFHKLRSI
jgi:MFS family permease